MTDPKFEQEARKLIEPYKYSLGVFGNFVLDATNAETLLAAEIQRVAELEKLNELFKAENERMLNLQRNTERNQYNFATERIGELETQIANREKEFEAILVEKNERIKEKDALLSKIEDAIYSQFCTESNCNSNVCRVANEMLSQILSLFPAHNSQQTERSEG